MKEYQEFNKELMPIKTIGQLVNSFLVAQCIVEIREERKKYISEMSKSVLPELRVKDERMIDLYYKFAEAVKYAPSFVLLAKIGLEDMKLYNFKEDPSVIKTASSDYGHLSNIYGSNYTILANINLEEHTLNVFEKAIIAGSKQGRVMQIGLPMIACLYHDFGKSTKIREELLGNQSGRGYKPHAEVSEMYVKNILLQKYLTEYPKGTNETIDKIGYIVRNHHNTNKKLKSDPTFQFVTNADILARKMEETKIRLELNKK